MRLSAVLYRLARLSRDVESVERTAETGNTQYAVRRANNKVANGLMHGYLLLSEIAARTDGQPVRQLK